MKIILMILITAITLNAHARSFWSHSEPKEPKADAPANIGEIDEPYMPDDDNVMDEMPYKEPPEPPEQGINEPEPRTKEPDPLLLEPDIRGLEHKLKEPQPLILEPREPIFVCPKGLEC